MTFWPLKQGSQAVEEVKCSGLLCFFTCIVVFFQFKEIPALENERNYCKTVMYLRGIEEKESSCLLTHSLNASKSRGFVRPELQAGNLIQLSLWEAGTQLLKPSATAASQAVWAGSWKGECAQARKPDIWIPKASVPGGGLAAGPASASTWISWHFLLLHLCPTTLFIYILNGNPSKKISFFESN